MSFICSLENRIRPSQQSLCELIMTIFYFKQENPTKEIFGLNWDAQN